MVKKEPTMLIILDGFGVAPLQSGKFASDATKASSMTHMRFLEKTYPHTTLLASGAAVGLPDNVMGNSEVGHSTIGSGRITPSALLRFNNAIESGDFYQNQEVIQAFLHVHQEGKRIHITGLLSQAGVHSSIEHIYAFLKLAKECTTSPVYLHLFLDGRDMQKESATPLIVQVEAWCKELKVGHIASIHGRFYAMDRDRNWDRTKQSYDVLTDSTKYQNIDWKTLLARSYAAGLSDEFVVPTLLDQKGILIPGDGIVMLNIRPERIHQLAESIFAQSFHAFTRRILLAGKLAFLVSPINYAIQSNPTHTIVLFKPIPTANTLVDVIAQAHKRILCIAETEKYAHITYFLHGENSQKSPFETDVLIPSIKTKTYASYPAMSACEITNYILDALEKNKYDVYLINYANADMVGHAADFSATREACNILDAQLEKLYTHVVKERGGTLFITADHGNAECNRDPESGAPLGMHTTNPVPFIAVGSKFLGGKCHNGLGLASIAPTILAHLGLAIPKEMDHPIIIK